MPKQSWIDSGEFSVKTCATVKKYVMHKTGIPSENLEVHKTDRYLYVIFSVGGKMNVFKVDTGYSMHLYCLDEKDFDGLFSAIEAAAREAAKV